jgi:tryptophanase
LARRVSPLRFLEVILMGLRQVVEGLPHENELSVKPRPYFNHSVEFKRTCTPRQRMAVLEEVGLNVFFFPSRMITGCDFLSDSGVTTMTNEQWASLHTGDEAYGSNRGYFELMEQIRDVFGPEFFEDMTRGQANAFIFHQGRSAEDALFSRIGQLGKGLVIPSNGHFDTTAGNMEANRIEPLNLFSPELKDPRSKSLFRGDMDVERLKQLLKKSAGSVPLVYITITNNTGGGQPVSLANIKEVAGITHERGIPFFIDACRFAENAYFIKMHEKGYARKGIKEIIREIFSYADGFTVSFKKDGLANMGGGLFIRSNGLFAKKHGGMLNSILDYQIMKEGHPTYGGLSGRDIMALATGLKTVTREEYLAARVGQVQDFCNVMHAKGLPVVHPAGGHAVYLDVNGFFKDTSMKPGDFGGISLTAVLLAAYGHRACELGYFAFGSYDPKTGKESFPEVNFVRFAVPRLRYEKTDLDSTAEAVKNLYDMRDSIPPVDVVHGKELTLRHFKARFRFRK